MLEEKNNQEILEKYLLGMFKDEEMLERIENRLADEPQFSEELEFVRDSLIEQYLDKELSGEKLKQFEKIFLKSKTQRESINFNQAIRDYALENNTEKKVNEPTKSMWDWFTISPKLAFGMALPILCLMIFGLWFLVIKQNESDKYLANIDSLYQNNRPTLARINDFKYLPYSATRGDGDHRDATQQRKFSLLEKELLENSVNNPNSESLNALGVFYLTEKRLDDAINQFKEALNYTEEDTQTYGNLGVAYFEKSNIQTEDEEKLKLRAMALEETTKAVNKGDKKPELLFNRALILQEMNVPNQAIEAWKIYLEKDNKSKWADEARENLKKLELKRSNTFKTKEEVLKDFLSAFERNDEQMAWKIHSHTKEVNAQKFLPMQLARSYLIADEKKNQAEAEKNLKALKYIGKMEQEKNADVFFVDWAKFYEKADDRQKEILREAQKVSEQGLKDLSSSTYADAVKNLKQSRELFLSVSNKYEAGMLEVPLAFCLTRTTNIAESNKFLDSVEKFAREKNYKWLLSTGLDWKHSNLGIENELSKSIIIGKESLQIAEETENAYQIQRIAHGIGATYAEIGETANSLKYLAKTVSLKDLYNENYKQAWRNYQGQSSLFSTLNLHEASIVFAKEYLNVSWEIKDDPSHLKLSYYKIARTYSTKGDYKKAQEMLKLGDKIILDKNQVDVQKNLLSTSKLEEANIKRNTGNCAEAIKDYDEAIRIFSELSGFSSLGVESEKGKLFCYWKDKNQELTEKQLNKILDLFERDRIYMIEEQSRNAFFHNEQTIYDIAIELALKKGDSREAFKYSEESKARSLLDFMQNGAKVTEEDLQFEKVAKPLLLEETQSRMLAETQVVQYALLPDKIVVWIIKKDSFEYVIKEYPYNKLEKKIDDYLNTIKNEKNNLDKINSKSNELYEILITPIVSKIDKNKSLFIVGDKALHRLPFASLYSKKSKRYLIEDLTITNTPSSTIFILTTENAQKKSENESIISIGNPNFDREENPKLENLDSAKDEAIEVSDFYEEKDVFYENNATRDKLLEKFDDAEIIHFAGHYVANEKSPINSKLLMANNETEVESDLRVSEIATKKNNNLKLVVLSACQTDVEQFYFGEGAIGAARIFLGIGSPIVVASFYEVDSKSTSKLMINFHNYRKNKGLNVAEALRKSQIDAIHNANATNDSPYYWFAFSPTGGFTNY